MKCVGAVHVGNVNVFQCILVKSTTFDSNFVNFSLNVIKFGMLINNIEIDMSHDFGCYRNHLGEK